MNTDPLGLYSPKAHDALIRYAFKNSKCVSAVDYVYMQVASRIFDTQTQAPDPNAFHSLLRPGQDPTDMSADRAAFISQMSNAIRGMGDTGRGGANRQAAMIVFGYMAHPLMDRYSPSHNLAAGSPASWDPFNWRSFFSTISHSPNEWIAGETVDDITQAAYDNVSRDLNALYNDVFGCDCDG